MNDARGILFGKFSRAVGNPHQHCVHSRAEFDAFIEKNLRNRNLYSSISHYTPDGVAITDKISLDFDSPRKETSFPMTESEDEKIDIMRQKSEIAHEVLDEVIDDARKVAEWAQEREIPILGVFTGFGIHIHLLYQETVYPESELLSTAVMLKEELDLETLDRVPIGDVHRIMRIPNCERVYNGRSCRLWTIPLNDNEILTWEVEDLLSESKGWKTFESDGFDRPEMQVYDDYTPTNVESVHREPVEVNGMTNLDDDYIEWLLKEALKLPCMWKRVMQPDPSHQVRLNAAVMLFNYGLTPDEVHEVFRKLNWVDWDSKTTKQQLHHIHDKGYADMSCESLKASGLCVFERGIEEDECPTYDWSGGNKNY